MRLTTASSWLWPGLAVSMAGFLGMFSSVLQQRTANGVETLKVESNIPNVHSFTISHIIHVPHICQHVCHFRCRCSSIYVMNTYSGDFRRIKSYKIYTQIFANPSLLVYFFSWYILAPCSTTSHPRRWFGRADPQQRLEGSAGAAGARASKKATCRDWAAQSGTDAAKTYPLVI